MHSVLLLETGARRRCVYQIVSTREGQGLYAVIKLRIFGFSLCRPQTEIFQTKQIRKYPIFPQNAQTKMSLNDKDIDYLT